MAWMHVCLFALPACQPCFAHTKAFTIGVFVGIRGVPREVVGDAGRDRPPVWADRINE